ncbi:acyl-CoA dehydratase activase [Anaeroselena agilis]|uniref:Acyl-CoA dehydratase activase n=1 Tax=Anaeroselena agilis TaxID=3063788 RepID=A0ABU3NTL6_9FIRM|nr:acyl-CoA dehydratase activase [Selenomonadales bacterium 4137-cl]
MERKTGIVAGIDAGSTAIKVTLYDGTLTENMIEPAGWNGREVAAGMLARAASRRGVRVEEIARIYGTGYGRVGLVFLTKAVTEITCHARGAAFLAPGVGTVIDIGGQDVKAIRVDGSGRVLDFIMNDKCAAGTGRFLQVMAGALGMDLATMASLSAVGAEACPINTMCTVFAESEVIGLLNRGTPRETIIAGLYKSIASRVAAMTARITPCQPVVLTGGVALHPSMHKALESELKLPVTVPGQAVFAGSVGAALLAWDDLQRGGE